MKWLAVMLLVLAGCDKPQAEPPAVARSPQTPAAPTAESGARTRAALARIKKGEDTLRWAKFLREPPKYNPEIRQHEGDDRYLKKDTAARVIAELAQHVQELELEIQDLRSQLDKRQAE